MAELYIHRRLAAHVDGKEISISQTELKELGLPLVILGDPGIGKTRLTQDLAKTWGIERKSAGSFCRLSQSAFDTKSKAIIIDGLDELAVSAGRSAVDEVLRKLALIGAPEFVISCRAADWNGAADKQKIWEDYGVEPKIVRIEPFEKEDAEHLLNARGLDGRAVISTLETMGLQDFYKNPLTLTLIAEIGEKGETLPNTREALIDKASALLIQERNPQHRLGIRAAVSVERMLSAAGQMFAHLLLSGSLGVADLDSSAIPAGYVSKEDISALDGEAAADAVLKSRLFEATGENLLAPYHRIIAEFLAGRWLAYMLDAGLSGRRAYRALTFAGGVPSALRGVHAWFGHFAPTMTEKCIRNDPYGAMRYGDPSGLTLQNARVLLQALGSLADEDPYFRSEDWGKRAVGGLARVELKQEILTLLTRPDRHVHLSTLILEALHGSQLAIEIIPELVAILENNTAAYAERYNAGEAIAAAGEGFDWPLQLRKLRVIGGDDSLRLSLDLAARHDPNKMPVEDLAETILQYHGITKGGPRRAVMGVTYYFVKKLSPETASRLLDQIANFLMPKSGGKQRRVGSEMTSTIFDMIVRSLDRSEPLTAAEMWRWFKMVEGEHGWNEEERTRIATYIDGNVELRKEIQRGALLERDGDGSPWMALAMALPQASSSLRVTAGDAALFLDEIAQKPAPLSKSDIELWSDLVRFYRGREGVEPTIEKIATQGAAKHAELKANWEALKTPVRFEWEAEEKRRAEKHAKEQEQRFSLHRQQFGEGIQAISSGADIGALHDIAKAYLGLYYDLDAKLIPQKRVEEWLGEELARAALSGFHEVIRRKDLPTAQMIGQLHSEGRSYNAEFVMIVSLAEGMRKNGTLDGIAQEILRSTLAAWNEMPEHYASKLGMNIGPELERLVLCSSSEIARFIQDTIAPSVKVGKESVSHLYRFCREEIYQPVVGEIALDWLRSYHSAHPAVQDELIGTALIHSNRAALKQLIRERAAEPDNSPGPLMGLWMGAAFVADFEHFRDALTKYLQSNKDGIWALRNAVRFQDGDSWITLNIDQLEFIIEILGIQHPPVERPEGGWMGDQNPWDAEEFIKRSINSLAAKTNGDAKKAFDRLADNFNPYHASILHMRAIQSRALRDIEYVMPTFVQTRAMLESSLPRGIDDLKALVLDALADAQDYLRVGDTMAWKVFWDRGRPIDENTCRDRLLDILRGNLPKAISAMAEARMPDDKRADMVAVFNGMALPIEAKGQWHSEVWAAPSDQLLDLYAKDYRADGRGIYLVFWFGNVPGKNLPAPAAPAKKPNTPDDLQSLLFDTLPTNKQKLIDVVVIDVSPTR